VAVPEPASDPLEPIVEVETVVGPLLLPQGDRVITAVLRSSHVWEPPETRFLQMALRPGQTFVDVGAHVGYFSVLAAKRVGPNGAVIALEPETRNLDLLQRNVARNDCPNVVVLPFAAGSAPGWMSLVLVEHNRGAHRLAPLGEADTLVSCVRLDDVLPGTVDVVKVDAQGYDHEVIDGMRRTLAANPRLVVIAELSVEELERRRLDPADVLAGYESLGFAISILDPFGRPRRMTSERVLEHAHAPGAQDFSLVLERIRFGGPARLGGPGVASRFRGRVARLGRRRA
jgi:FkbM family methyltransferase